jgi:hypothetical protein
MRLIGRDWSPHMVNYTMDEEKVVSQFQNLIRSEHWLGSYVRDLLSAHELSAGIDFNAANQLLAAEKDQFERDLAVAKRMLRIYGRTVLEDSSMQQAAV